VKSGYGLATEAELRSLEAIRAAAAGHPVAVVPTFLGAHEVPLEHRAERERYLRLLVDEMIPEVARRRLAAFADVFCEQGVFSVAESRRILAAARDHGLGLRVHADELAATGGRAGGRDGRALGRPSRPCLGSGDARARRGSVRGDAFALGVVLPAPAALRARPRPRRRGSSRRARHRRQPRRRALALDAVRDDGGLFLDGSLLRGGRGAATVNAADPSTSGRGGPPGRARADLVALRSPRLLDLLTLASVPSGPW
jgi:hypothetical protein